MPRGREVQHDEGRIEEVRQVADSARVPRLVVDRQFEVFGDCALRAAGDLKVDTVGCAVGVVEVGVVAEVDVGSNPGEEVAEGARDEVDRGDVGSDDSVAPRVLLH